MALGKEYYKELYKELSVDELKKKIKSNNSFINKIFLMLLEHGNKKKDVDDNSPISDNENENEAIKELIIEKQKMDLK